MSRRRNEVLDPWLGVKRLEAAEARITEALSKLQKERNDIHNMRTAMRKFFQRCTEREKNFSKKVDALLASQKKMMRDVAALADKLEDTDIHHEAAVRRDLRFKHFETP